MKTLQHRRHSMRLPDGHLSLEGLELARRVGLTIGPTDYSASSDVTRAWETAQAMGFQVRERFSELALIPDIVAREVPWDGGYAVWYDAVQKGGSIVKGYSQMLKRLHLALLSKIPEGGRLLIVSHSGVVEASAAACFESEEVRQWGAPVSYCEGFELQFENGQFISGKALRI
jgi:broad specificity phosphatase PhoE